MAPCVVMYRPSNPRISAQSVVIHGIAFKLSVIAEEIPGAFCKTRILVPDDNQHCPL
jgi:hypothetical protein